VTFRNRPTCCRFRMAFATGRSTPDLAERVTAKSGHPPASRNRVTPAFARRGRTAHHWIVPSRRRTVASPRMRCSGRTTRTASASSNLSVFARSFGGAASVARSAHTHCVDGTTRVAARRLSTA
jgi:hypothetical protein